MKYAPVFKAAKDIQDEIFIFINVLGEAIPIKAMTLFPVYS